MLRVFEMGCLRRIMDVTRRDHIKNMDIRANLDITEDIVERIQATQSCGQNGPTPSARHWVRLYGRVEGKRVKGRPRKRWLDNVTDDCYHRGWSIVEAGYTPIATDRQRWRTYIRLSRRAPASPWQQQEEEEEDSIWILTGQIFLILVHVSGVTFKLIVCQTNVASYKEDVLDEAYFVLC